MTAIALLTLFASLQPSIFAAAAGSTAREAAAPETINTEATSSEATNSEITSTDKTYSAESTFLVALQPHLTAEERGNLLDSYDAELVRWIPQLNLAEIRVGGSGGAIQAASTSANSAAASRAESAMSIAAQVAALANHSAVEFIEENALFHGTADGTAINVEEKVSPDDPELHNSTNGYAQRLLHMESAWNYTMGNANVVIAVLDTGVDANHPELAGQLVQGYDFVNEAAQPIDDNGHGTHVSGIIAARINNSQGSAGICPGCRLMPIKVLDSNNVGVWSVIVQGIVYAADNGAKIINLSLGSADHSDAVRRAVEYAQEKGVLLVAAAGNSRSKKLFYPAAYSGVISVSATDNEDREWSLSNRGTYIDVAAPGYLIYSTSISEEKYSYMTGTSMAAPFVAGVAGLLLSQTPHSSAAELTDRIIQSTVDLGPRGWDAQFGFGRVDAYAALVKGAGLNPLAPLGANGRQPIVYLPFINQ